MAGGVRDPVYVAAVRDFSQEVSIAWAQICMTRVPYHHGLTKVSGILLALLYLHAIVSQTLASRRTTPENITQLETFLLAHRHRGITFEMGRIVAHIMRGFANDHKSCVWDIGHSSLG